MIIEELKLIREGDRPAKDKYRFKRRHLRIKCDICDKIWIGVLHTYIKSGCYHSNNEENKDFCSKCLFKWKKDRGYYKRPSKNALINPSEFHPSSQIRIKNTRSSNGYVREWTNDINHPRLSKNKRDKNPMGGRVYQHILVIEKKLGRYLSNKEKVHHINGDKTDNNPDNLYLCKDAQHHGHLHKKMEQFIFGLIKQGVVRFNADTEEFELK